MEFKDPPKPEQPIPIEIPKTPEELAVYTADVQARTFRALSDALGNIITGPIGHKELRGMNITDDVPTVDQDLNTLLGALEPLKQTSDRIQNLLSKEKKPLPEIDEGSGSMVDLKYRKYEKPEDLNPINPTKP